VVRKLAITLAILAGLILVAIGIRRWLDYRSARNVVTSFVVGVRDGQREDVLNLMEPSQRVFVESRLKKKDNFWSPSQGLTYRILEIHIAGNKADCRIWIERDGFRIKPWFHLNRMESGSWKIRKIDHTEVDERWNDLMEDRARTEGNQLADELHNALKDNKDVTVERHKKEE